MNRVSAPGVPSIDCRRVLVQILSISPSTLVQSRPPGVSPKSLDYGLEVRTIVTSKCISPNSLDPSTASQYWSKLAQLQPPSSNNYSLQVRTIIAPKCISKLARIRHPSSHDHGLQVHISELARSRPSSESPNSLDCCLQGCTIMASRCIYTLA